MPSEYFQFAKNTRDLRLYFLFSTIDYFLKYEKFFMYVNIIY